MIKNIKYIVTAMALLFILPVTAIAQGNTGKLTGKVTDSSNNLSLHKVSVVVKSSGVGVATITDGTYILSLAPGTYTIRYSYAGFATQDVNDVVIKKGETTYLDVTLAPKSTMIGIVISTTTLKKIENQGSLYRLQKTNAAAMDVMSVEVIRKTPDNTVAQAMRRMPGTNIQDGRFVVVRGLGDQYNQTMLNGVVMTSTESNRNAFALDLIPVAVLDNITVTKTATPDMPGNFAGGIVQINTKEFPANDFISIAAGAGFSDATLGKNFYGDKRGSSELFGSGAKSRDLPKDFPSPFNTLGSLTNLNIVEQQRYLRMLKNDLVPINHGPSQLNENMQLGYGKTIKFKNNSQFGIVAALGQRKTELIEDNIISRDYTPNPSGPTIPVIGDLDIYFEARRNIYNSNLGGVINLAYNFGKNKITFKNLYSQIVNNTFTERKVAVASSNNSYIGGRSIYGLTYIFEQKQILNSILGGEHRSGKDNDTRIDWNFNITTNNTKLPDVTNFLFVRPNGMENLNRFSLDNNIADIQTALQQSARAWQTGKDFITGGAFNITTPVTILKNKQLFKAGILYQNRKRNLLSNTVVYQNLGAGTGLPLDSILDPSILNIGPNLSPFSAQDQSFNSGTSLLAAYASFDSKIGKKLRIIWGLRAENYLQFIEIPNASYFPNFNNYDAVFTSIGSNSTFNFLPSINTVYAITPKLNIRGAFSKTVARPELKDVAPITQINYVTFILSQGNPLLKTTSINNYDLKFEIFPAGGEIITFSAFYKQLKDPIEFIRNPTALSFVQPLNTGDTYIQGLEAEIRKKIDFLPFAKWLKNVTIFGNGTLLKARVSRIETIVPNYPQILEHTLVGQPKYIINTGITIAAFKNSFEGTLSFNKTGDHVYLFGDLSLPLIQANGVVNVNSVNTMVKARDMLDLSLSQDLFKNKCKIKINVSNLLKSPFIYYQDNNANEKFDDPIKIVRPLTGPLINTDVASGIDNTVTNINPQRTYSFTISYTF